MFENGEMKLYFNYSYFRMNLMKTFRCFYFVVDLLKIVSKKIIDQIVFRE